MLMHRCRNKILSWGATSYRDGKREIEKYATPFKSPLSSKSGGAIAPPDHSYTYAMGTSCTPLLANLFLFYHEHKFMKAKLKQNSHVAKLLVTCFDTLMTYS